MNEQQGKKNGVGERENQRDWRSEQLTMLISEKQQDSRWFKASTCLFWLPAYDCCFLGPIAFDYKASLPLLQGINLWSSLPKDVPSGKTPHSGIEEKAARDLGMTICCLYWVLPRTWWLHVLCVPYSLDNTNNKQSVKYIKHRILNREVHNSTISLLSFLSVISSSLSLRGGLAL